MAKASILDRLPDNITCIAVSKTFPEDAIRRKKEEGFQHFGENRVKEFLAKHESLSDLDIVWHFIGHLQSNKVNKVVGKADFLHSLDSVNLYRKLVHACEQKTTALKVLLQVNISGEQQKAGFSPEDLFASLEEIHSLASRACPVVGLMCIGSSLEIAGDEFVRSQMREMQKLFLKLKQEEVPDLFEMKYLSMGMSSDWEIALEYGSNMVRVGSLIFGTRGVGNVR